VAMLVVELALPPLMVLAADRVAGTPRYAR
jgi:hypothetical protein